MRVNFVGVEQSTSILPAGKPLPEGHSRCVMTLDDCMRSAGITGGTIGAVGGAIVGGLLTGPLWFLGAIAGGVLGAGAGSLIGVLLCLARHKKDQCSFKMPRITSVRLSANPDPARKNVPCWLSIHYQVDGNDDRALCEITWWIYAEGATPADPPSYMVRNNGGSFGRAVSTQTTWTQEHDGRRVHGEVTLVARRGTEMCVTTERVPEIRVPVLP
jgi:hypothetical protein